MPCVNPLYAFDNGIKPNGKRDIQIVNRYKFYNGKDKKFYSYQTGKEVELMLLPCGQCIGCRIDYSRDWANRMMLEARYHENNCFVTLTYDELHVPYAPYVDANGELQYSMTLDKKHLQKFWKRLRKKLGKDTKIRYYACGEYGDLHKRPHYHAIIFGYDFPDREVYGNNDFGDAYYESDMLKELWPYGMCIVADVSWQTCAYVARYVVKKHKGLDKDYYALTNRVPEFVTMSRKPGIGREFYEDNKKKLYTFGKMTIGTHFGSVEVRPPRYFDSLYEQEEPDLMKAIRGERVKMSDNISDEKLRHTSQNYLLMLQDENDYLEGRISALARRKV